jgi:hypothetical protein
MTRLSSFKNKISKCTPKLITAALSFSCAKSTSTDSMHRLTRVSQASHGAPMKTNLSLACIALLLFSAQVSAQKLPPPGAYGRSNVLLMIDVGHAMVQTSVDINLSLMEYTGAIRLPSDVAVDSKGNVHVKSNSALDFGAGGITKLSPELKPISTYAQNIDNEARIFLIEKTTAKWLLTPSTTPMRYILRRRAIGIVVECQPPRLDT